MMDVYKTLAKAHYHIKRTKKTFGTTEYEYELNSFLSTIKSVPEHLLEDYNIKYSLNIPEKRNLMARFKKEAELRNNQQAIDFYKWWYSEDKRLKEDKICSLIFDKRNISIHRRLIKADLSKSELKNTVHLTNSLRIVMRDTEGQIVHVSETVESPKKEVIPEKEEIKIKLFFEEHPDEDVLEICEKIYNMMETLVKNATSKFS